MSNRQVVRQTHQQATNKIKKITMDNKNDPSTNNSPTSKEGPVVTSVNFHPMDVSRPNDEDNSPNDEILAVQGLVGMGTHGFPTTASIPVDMSTSTAVTSTSMATSSNSLSSSSSHVSSINDAATTNSFNPSSISSYGIGTTSTSIFSKLPSGSMSTFTALRNSMRPPVRQSDEHMLHNKKDECEGESDHEEKSTTGSRGTLTRRRRQKESPGGLLPSSASSATNRFLSSAILYDDKESRHHSTDITGRLSSSSSSSSSSTGLPVNIMLTGGVSRSSWHPSINNNNNFSTASTTNDAYMGNPSYGADKKVASASGNDNSASSSGRSKTSGSTSRSGGISGNDGSVGKASGTSGNDICDQLQPKLVLIFDTYCQHTQQPRINTSKPLLMLCLEHLVPFGCWVRETPNGCEWIREVGTVTT